MLGKVNSSKPSSRSKLLWHVTLVPSNHCFVFCLALDCPETACISNTVKEMKDNLIFFFFLQIKYISIRHSLSVFLFADHSPDNF